MKAAAVYSRVSTDEQTYGYSIATQIEGCVKHAEKLGFHVPQEFIFTEDYSGATLERPALDKMRALARTGAIGAVIVWEMDRLARKVVYQMLIEEDFNKLKAPIVYVLNNFDDTPEGQLQKQIRSSLSEFERAKIRERCMRGKRGRAQAGFVLVGPMAPYGYIYKREEHKGWLEIDEEEARIVRQIFEWYVYGDDTGGRLGARSIAQRLTHLNVPTKNDTRGYGKDKRGFGQWAKSTVSRILKSEVYAGTWYYNRTKSTGKSTYTARDKSEWIGVPVPAIVSRELWDAAQRQKDSNTVNSPRNTRYTYQLQGRLRCATCGLTFQTFTELRRGPKGYYKCGGQKLEASPDYRNKPCHRSLRQDVWEARVWEAVKEVLQNPDRIFASMSERQEELDNELGAVHEWLDSVEAKIEALDQKRARLLDLYLDTTSSMPQDLLKGKMAEIAQERERYEREAKDLRERLSQSTNMEQDAAQVKLYCEMASEGIDLFTEDDKRNTIAALNVMGIVQRGATPEEDKITLTGYIPTLEVKATDEVAAKTLGGCAPRLPPPPAPA